MSYTYPLSDRVDLLVKGRISAHDADRQRATAREILVRLQELPGVILADEVGMGKTFVALAVAASVTLADPDHRPAVVMVPPSLKEKWPTDFELFREKCLPPDVGNQIRAGKAEKAVDFLKLLDDEPSRRKRIIFITHGAMSRGLTDGWVKLALIRQALYHRHNANDLRRALCRFMGPLLHMGWVDGQDPDVWEKLLDADPADWLRILRRRGIDPEGDDNPETDDDPVPLAVQEVLKSLDTNELYQTLWGVVPKRASKYIDDHLKFARSFISEQLRTIWKECLKKLSFRLPLLVLDEAHHLKNDQTQLASLFHVADAQADADAISRGALGGVFERMLFLTATPFQLGHHELCSVLDRFGGIAWDSPNAPMMGKTGFAQKIEDLRAQLDAAQESAVTLDDAWGRLRSDDLCVDGTLHTDMETWWQGVLGIESPSPQLRLVRDRCRKTQERMKLAEGALKPWVIRHLKPRMLPPPQEQSPRRRRLPGETILTDQPAEYASGLAVGGESLLPFLLAARATACTPESRPIFAEGLASSYEAFMHTRRHRQQGDAAAEADSDTDTDDCAVETGPCDEAVKWYLDRLQAVLPLESSTLAPSHPKLAATVGRTVAIWKQGEKVVVFCHYIATGKALRQRIGQALADEISRMGAERLGCKPKEVENELDRIGKRFFDQDSPIRQACDAKVSAILKDFPAIEDYWPALIDIVRRYLRTPTFLVRYFPLAKKNLTADSMAIALETRDTSGLTLHQLLADFFRFLQDRCGSEDRARYVRAINSIQTGSHVGTDVAQTYSPDELQGDHSDRLLPNVRLVNGTTQQDTRQRLMLAFNTPFYPEVMVASSVMAEGVDLHLNCRHVIHHDLCWNPSTLEQRTGRIDRIGAKAERCGQPIHVYLPYVSETQDEKMYRVVMDRERWFSVVMGEKFKMDAKTTDRLSQRVPLPECVADALKFRLDVALPPVAS
jgi:hypothetical protein